MNDHRPHWDQYAKDGRPRADLRHWLTGRLDAIEKDTPSRVRPGQKKDLGARQKRTKARQNGVEV